LPKRELLAAIAIPIIVAVIVWLPSWVFLAVVAAVVVIAGHEMLAMARLSGIQIGQWPPLVLLAGSLAAAWVYGVTGLAVALTVVLLIAPVLQLARRADIEGSLAAVSVGCFTVLFLAVCGACFGWLRLWPENDAGIGLVMAYLGIVWIGDSAAYYVGRRWGRHRMSPRVSPNKTWEGLAACTIATFAAAAGLTVAFGVDISWPNVFVVAALIAVTGPLGDLIESLFKRDTGVKDSSALLPGHGGFLDRTDSLLYAAPPVLAYLVAAGLAP
jgi:phosphatidate cytidylyltransferase